MVRTGTRAGRGGERLMSGERNPLLQALRDQVEADQQQRIRCQHGEHEMLATASPGIVICRLCRTLGVCLWCGLTLPPGACIVVCDKHLRTVRWQAKQPQRTLEARPSDAKTTAH